MPRKKRMDEQERVEFEQAVQDQFPPEIYEERPEVLEAVPLPEKVTVRIVNKASLRDRGIVLVTYEDTGYLMPFGDVPEDVGDAELLVKRSYLDALPRAYDFRTEIASLLPTVQQVQAAFWRSGLVSLDDLSNLNRLRTALSLVLPGPQSFLIFKESLKHD